MIGSGRGKAVRGVSCPLFYLVWWLWYLGKVPQRAGVRGLSTAFREVDGPAVWQIHWPSDKSSDKKVETFYTG